MDILKKIKRVAIENEIEVYIVGGYIRDKLMPSKEIPLDLDLVCKGDITKIVLCLNECGFNSFFLKEELNMYRFTKGATTVDLCSLKGKTIEDDLKERDFTLNAVALDLVRNKIIDPFRGREHIKARVITEVTKDSIKNDRVRILRGVRFIIKYGMHFSKDTEIEVTRESIYINKCTRERVFHEIMKIINLDKNAVAFDVMDSYSILSNLIPYIEENKKIGKCKYHLEDAFTHMNMVYKIFKEIVLGKISINGFDFKILNNKIGDYSIKDYLAFAAFNHDIGKSLSYRKNGGKVSFKNHEVIGAKLIEEFCDYLKFPKAATRIVKDTVDGHMRPLKLFKEKSRKNYFDFFKTYEDRVPYILLISFCDVYATHSIYDPNNQMEVYNKFIEELVLEFQIYKDIIKSKMISGKDIKENFRIKPLYIGEALEYIHERMYIGEIKDKNQAMKKLSKWCIINEKLIKDLGEYK
ncbi:HD domain-containing protein [Haloimpatiens sp. FM7315]|uniref:HD domain-containing protein n=1 Tax=Haloimpatiens sp. FM7315 TaxID=3298609 RepID=UPI003977ADF7